MHVLVIIHSQFNISFVIVDRLKWYFSSQINHILKVTDEGTDKLYRLISLLFIFLGWGVSHGDAPFNCDNIYA